MTMQHSAHAARRDALYRDLEAGWRAIARGDAPPAAADAWLAALAEYRAEYDAAVAAILAGGGPYSEPHILCPYCRNRGAYVVAGAYTPCDECDAVADGDPPAIDPEAIDAWLAAQDAEYDVTTEVA